MRKIFIIGAVIAFAVIAALVFWLRQETPFMYVSAPKTNEAITSPLSFSGKARGFWFFEASFTVRVFDANGSELGIGIAQAQDEWMTEDFVPFSGTVVFGAPFTPTGKVVFQKDNPSGLPEHDAAIEIPVRFLKQ